MEAFERLEAEWAAVNGYRTEQVVACASGTAALHLALEAFRLPPGSQVVVPDYTMVACPRAVVAAGLTPVFADCDPDRLTLDPNSITEEMGRNASVVMPVAVYGRDVSNDVWAHAGFYSLLIVEDLAEAHGVHSSSQANDATCWSFYKNKIVAGEEGGAVAFKSVEHAEYARQLRSLGFTKEHDYTHVPRGWNHRMSNAHATLIQYGWDGIISMTANLERRREIESWYDESCPTEWKQPARDVVWVYDFRVRGMNRETQTAVVRALQVAGIGARFGFVPMTFQKEFRNISPTNKSPNAWVAGSEVIYLPVSPFGTRRDDCRRAFDVVREVIAGRT